MINKYPYLKRFIEEDIKPLTDKEFQERVWVRGEGPEISSFSEVINDFFDNGTPILEDIKDRYLEYGISEEQYTLLVKLFNKLDRYCEITPISPRNEDVVKDPKWWEIRDFAKKVYEKLKDRAV